MNMENKIKNIFTFLKDNNVVFRNAYIFGILDDQRIQWQDQGVGLVTLDFVYQSRNKNNAFHEISIRYPENTGTGEGIEFENFIRSLKIKVCPNQIDWPINKFEILDILNSN
jgi:hypothetical protein